MDNIEKIIKRDAFKELKAHLKEKEITVLIGPRQAGKTTLVKQLISFLKQEEKTPEQRILYFNLDLHRDLALFSDQAETIALLKSRLENNEKLYVFIDEVQRIKNAGLFLKGIYDLDLAIKFIITGSSTLEIKSKVQEPLTGRKRMFHIFPLSFSEFLSYKRPEIFRLLDRGGEMLSYDQNLFFDSVKEFAVFGGYPRVVIEDNFNRKAEILEELYSSYIEKDIVNFLQIRNPIVLSRLVSLLSAQVGQIANVSELASSIGVEMKTVKHYLDILEQTFVISRITPFFTNRRKELIKSPKVFFIDNGLRNFSINKLKAWSGRTDIGAIFENMVAAELIKMFRTPASLHYWRTINGAEVDFVIRFSEQNIIPIEVKSKELKQPNIPAGLINFRKKYNPKISYLVNPMFEHILTDEYGKVSFLPVIALNKILNNAHIAYELADKR